MAHAPQNSVVESRLVLTQPTIAATVAALVGLVIVIVPADVIRGSGLLTLRQAYDHAFVILVLLVTAWASWRVAVEVGTHRVRVLFLRQVASTYDALTDAEQRSLVECMRAADLTVRRGYRSGTLLSLESRGFLEPMADGTRHRYALMTATMAPDVATVLRAHLEMPPGPPSAARGGGQQRRAVTSDPANGPTSRHDRPMSANPRPAAVRRQSAGGYALRNR